MFTSTFNSKFIKLRILGISDTDLHTVKRNTDNKLLAEWLRMQLYNIPINTNTIFYIT